MHTYFLACYERRFTNFPGNNYYMKRVTISSVGYKKNDENLFSSWCSFLRITFYEIRCTDANTECIKFVAKEPDYWK